MGGAIDKNTGVTKQQDAFCKAYVLNMGNGADAARQAKFETKRADAYAYTLLRKVEIRRRIKYWEDHFHEELMSTKEKILRETAALATFNPQDLYDEDGNLIPIHKLDRETAISVQEITMNNRNDGDQQVIQIKAGKEKGAALEKLMKHYNAYEDHRNSGKAEITVFMTEKDALL